MVKNVISHMKRMLDRVRKSVEYPGVLENIKADDATFELSISNTIERLQLFHRTSIYPPKFTKVVGQGKTVGIIFINSRARNLIFKLREVPEIKIDDQNSDEKAIHHQDTIKSVAQTPDERLEERL